MDWRKKENGPGEEIDEKKRKMEWPQCDVILTN